MVEHRELAISASLEVERKGFSFCLWFLVYSLYTASKFIIMNIQNNILNCSDHCGVSIASKACLNQTRNLNKWTIFSDCQHVLFLLHSQSLPPILSSSPTFLPSDIAPSPPARECPCSLLRPDDPGSAAGTQRNPPLAGGHRLSCHHHAQLW